MSILFLNSVLFLILSLANGANILAVVSIPSYSHQIAYRRVWNELSSRGHKVTLLTTDPVNDPKLPNLREIDLKGSYQCFETLNDMAENGGMWSFQQDVRPLFAAITEFQLSHNEVQDLIKNETAKFDLVFAEFLFPEFLAFAEIYTCPKIILSSLDASSIFHHAMGNDLHPVLNPDIGAPFFGELSFWERLQSTLYTWHTLYYVHRHTYADKDKAIRKYFNISKSTAELINDVDMLFLNVNPIINNIRTLGPATITIGDIRRGKSSRPLPKDLKEFLDNSTDGFIYFSLGSTVQTKELKRNSLNNIIQALREMPYNVLWKFEDDHLPGKPDNVRIIKWAPQLEILSHSNIKLFVTQGGLQSMEEGIFNEVPFVVIPFFADQELNAKSMKFKGIAEIVEKMPEINTEDLKNAMLLVINNESYRNSVRKLKKLAVDMPLSGVEKAVWWTEYVIRNKGAKHLRNPAADLPFYQYYLLDVIGFLLIVFLATLMSTYLFLRRVLRLFKRISHKSHDQNKKNQ